MIPLLLSAFYRFVLYFCLEDSLFVFRNATQGLSKPMIPMISGILEMVLRIGVVATFLPEIGFQATAFAEVATWLGALLINIIAF